LVGDVTFFAAPTPIKEFLDWRSPPRSREVAD
jgi:hypothetical protein